MYLCELCFDSVQTDVMDSGNISGQDMHIRYCMGLLTINVMIINSLTRLPLGDWDVSEQLDDEEGSLV